MCTNRTSVFPPRPAWIAFTEWCQSLAEFVLIDTPASVFIEATKDFLPFGDEVPQRAKFREANRRGIIRVEHAWKHPWSCRTLTSPHVRLEEHQASINTHTYHHSHRLLKRIDQRRVRVFRRGLTGLKGLHVPLERADCSSFDVIEPDPSASTLSRERERMTGLTRRDHVLAEDLLQEGVCCFNLSHLEEMHEGVCSNLKPTRLSIPEWLWRERWLWLTCKNIRDE